MKRDTKKVLEALEEGKPIVVQPTREYTVTRLILVPVGRTQNKLRGWYMKVPAHIHVRAFTGGEAAAVADEIQANTHRKIWQGDSTPWNPRSVDWREVEVPPDTPCYELR